MNPAPFEYRRAGSVAEAVELLGGTAGSKVLAGGHSLLPMMKLRLAAPTLVVDIGGIDELRFIRREGDDLVVGALATHAEVAASADVRAGHTAMAEAAASIGDVQVRNCGTVAGSLAHADPAADYGAAVFALDAEVLVQGASGERAVPCAELFAGLLQTTLDTDEVITAVRFPGSAGARSVYEKFAQPASGFAIVGVAAEVTKDESGSCAGARLAATGVADRPCRLTSVEAALVGGALDADSIEAAAAVAPDHVEDAREDLYADRDYRLHLLRVLTRRAVARAAG